MNNELIRNVAIVAGSLCFVCFPLDRKRVRAPWAKLLMVIGGFVGFASGTVGVLLATERLAASRAAVYGLYSAVYLTQGAFLGIIISLIASGQLLGQKVVKPEVTNVPVA